MGSRAGASRGRHSGCCSRYRFGHPALIQAEMLLHSVIVTNSCWAKSRRPLVSTLFRCFSISSNSFASITSPEASHIDEDFNDFLPWLEHKAAAKISSALSIGNSSYGRGLYAAKDIETGDCLLKVPYSVQLSSDNLPVEITCLLGDEVGNVAKVALLILHEKKLGQNSEWAPYISCLPQAGDLHSTIFWSNDELAMIQPSALYEETLRQKAQIEKDFCAVKLVFDQFPRHFRDVTLHEFTYAYGLVTSRAWGSSRDVSMIPFADFLNHDGTSEAYVLCNESKNILSYDQVQIELNIPQHDRLYTQKLELLDRHSTRSIKDVNEFTSSQNSFTIKEVKTGSKKGKGIPQSLRAFARILTCNSQEELNDLALEAAQNDGRLARYPLKNKNREIAAHQLLLSEISQLVEEHNKYIKLLVPAPPYLCGKSVLRRRLAQDLLTGELRVLKSATAWLENYCSTLLTK
ncbi:UNVERIFIED_CONTAM: hypothetical protein Scaly_2365600 [Sesamum calycinum]|uniref:Rubisco LSMT substrate-binding domain-containing protein n=1 Tax=Sesamum calycinum TaxID=2727403 RepID=A0AAW2LXR5_9LAMI